MNLFRALLAALAACALSSAFAQWQWMDKDGRKVFSDRAPPPEVLEKDIVRRPVVRVQTRPAPTGDEAAEAPSGVPPSAPASGLPKIAGVDKDLEARKKQAADAEAAKRKADEERVAKTKIENCARAKQAKTTFDSGVRVSRTNAAGEREIMDDDARAAELRRIQGILASDCL